LRSKSNFSQDEILQLYEQLQLSGIPKVLSRFEKIIVSFCKEIQRQHDQNVQLQHVFESEREAHNRRMNEVENEIEQHIAEMQQHAREEVLNVAISCKIFKNHMTDFYF
uniref:Drf_FH3 domain-containing protein n=1 Tax=Onchocerca flexuosa TaxID=387005 RepID=A0A183H4A7_9BILA